MGGEGARADRRLREVAVLFGRLGLTAFGGPAAHIGMFEQEVVQRRGWIDRRRFLDLLGVTQLIPGPNSTEIAIHLGLLRAGVPGLLVAGVCFVGPAVLFSLLIARAYVAGAGVPQLDAFLRGVQPVAWAMIVAALVRLAPVAAASARALALASVVAAAAWVGVNPLVCLLGAGVVGALAGAGARWRGRALLAGSVVVAGASRAGAGVGAQAPGEPGGIASAVARAAAATGSQAVAVVAATAAAPIALGTLALAFLQIGALLYGSGYVLIAYLERVFVHGNGWLSGAELVDAVAVGQITPGPVLSTAAFVGYLLGGWSGGLVAAVAIFAPSFLYVAALHPVLPYLRSYPLTSAFLDGVNAAAVALIAVVAARLAPAAVHGGAGAAIAAAALALRWRDTLPAPVLVLCGGVCGWLLG